VADWYTLESIRADWRDAPQSDTVLQQLIDVAKDQVLEFDLGATWRRNPANAGTDWPGGYGSDTGQGDVPQGLLMAQRAQARNLWNASRVDPSNGSTGDDTFVIRPFPMDWTVKNMIRPKRPFGSFA
jgi:hypothetical protein